MNVHACIPIRCIFRIQHKHGCTVIIKTESRHAQTRTSRAQKITPTQKKS
jgi:hypothetical protein